MQYVLFNIDENGNKVDHLYINEKPEKIYRDRVDHYGDKREKYQLVGEKGEKHARTGTH